VKDAAGLYRPAIEQAPAGAVLNVVDDEGVPASSTITRELLDWKPIHPGLIEDLEQGHHFI
jgi:hypothetical protein